MGEVVPMHFARQNRQNADSNKSGDNDNADPFLKHRRTGNAPMLDKEYPQHDERADKEGGIQMSGAKTRHRKGNEFP